MGYLTEIRKLYLKQKTQHNDTLKNKTLRITSLKKKL